MTPALVVRDRCPGCETHQRTLLLRKPWDDAALVNHLTSTYGAGRVDRVLELAGERPFCVWRCAACRLAYQELAPNEQLATEIYERWIDADEAAEHDRSKLQAPLLALQVMEIVHHFQRPAAALKVLDYGTGSGEWCRVAHGMGCEAYGTDLSEARLSTAERHGVRLVSLEEAQRHQFDFINLEQVIEHITAPLDLVTSLASLLRPDGVMRISVPNARDLDRRLRHEDWAARKGTTNSLNVIDPLQHLNAFEHRSLVAMASLAGLRPVRRAATQLRFTPMVGGWLNCVRYGSVRFLRSALRQDTQIWFVPRADAGGGLPTQRPST